MKVSNQRFWKSRYAFIWSWLGTKCVFAPDVPAVHDFFAEVSQDVDARHKAGHDG